MALIMVGIAWLWYGKVFRGVWEQYSGGHIPMKAEGETYGSYMKRVWVRGLAQVLFNILAVFALILFLNILGGIFIVPLLIVALFYIPVIGSRIIWMKDRTAGQKGALLGIDVGYILIALYAVMLLFPLWTRLSGY